MALTSSAFAPLPTAVTTLPAALLLQGARHAVDMHLTRPLSVAGRWDDADLVHVVSEAFALSMPHALGAAFLRGAAPPCTVLPFYYEADGLTDIIRKASWAGRGLEIREASVIGSHPILDASGQTKTRVWLQPRSIIGVLIAL